MKRQPSIHITEKQLKGILRDMWPDDSPMQSHIDEYAKEIVYRAKNLTITTRSITVTNNKLENKVKTLLKAKESDSELLANLIYHIRRRKTKLYTTKRIDKGSNDYKALKELTVVCLDFSNNFGLSKKEGFTKYLEIAVPRINSSLHYVKKLISLSEKVWLEYEAIVNISKDDKPKETKHIHDIYVNLISEKTGMTNDYIDNPIVYQKFIEVREITDKIDVPTDIYIKSQFHGLSWTDSYPEPNQLVGEKALVRLNKYLYENKISLKKNIDKSKSNILLNLGKKHGNDRDN